MPVHIQISDPFELVPPDDAGASVQAELPDDALRANANASGNVTRIVGLDAPVATVEIHAHVVDYPLSRLLEGKSVPVRGRLLTPSGDCIEFLGSGHDARKATGPWPFHDD